MIRQKKMFDEMVETKPPFQLTIRQEVIFKEANKLARNDVAVETAVFKQTWIPTLSLIPVYLRYTTEFTNFKLS